MGKTYNLEIGAKLQFLTGNDRNKPFTIISDLQPCARTEGCYTAIMDEGMTVYIFPSELKKHGYAIIN